MINWCSELKVEVMTSVFYLNAKLDLISIWSILTNDENCNDMNSELILATNDKQI